MTNTRAKALEALERLEYPDEDSADKWQSDFEIVRKALSEPKWKSMDSAPRDGTKVLLSIPVKYVKSGNLRKKKDPWICLGFWKFIDAESVNINGMNERRLSLYNKHGGYWTNHFRGEQPLNGEPSHYQLLPPPPTGEKS